MYVARWSLLNRGPETESSAWCPSPKPIDPRYAADDWRVVTHVAPQRSPEARQRAPLAITFRNLSPAFTHEVLIGEKSASDLEEA